MATRVTEDSLGNWIDYEDREHVQDVVLFHFERILGRRPTIDEQTEWFNNFFTDQGVPINSLEGQLILHEQALKELREAVASVTNSTNRA